MKTFELEYLLEPLETHPSFFTKRMFGGLAVYYDFKMVLVLMEDYESRSYRGQEYPYLIWNGLLIPTDRDHHASLTQEFPKLFPHPVLGKWLFLSLDEDLFEDHSERVVAAIRRKDPRFGILPKEKKSKKKRAPRYLRSLQNLGPQTEENLKSVGITTVKEFYQAGWEEAYCRLVLADPKFNNLNMLCALIGATTNTDWRELDPKDKKEAEKWVQYFK